jgi:hypothetical protein
MLLSSRWLECSCPPGDLNAPAFRWLECSCPPGDCNATVLLVTGMLKSSKWLECSCSPGHWGHWNAPVLQVTGSCCPPGDLHALRKVILFKTLRPKARRTFLALLKCLHIFPQLVITKQVVMDILCTQWTDVFFACRIIPLRTFKNNVCRIWFVQTVVFNLRDSNPGILNEKRKYLPTLLHGAGTDGDPRVECRPSTAQRNGPGAGGGSLCDPNPCGTGAICTPGSDVTGKARPVCTCP